MNQYQDIAERWENYQLNEGKKERPGCIPGNPVHRKSDGRFATKGTEGTWSLAQDESDANKGQPGCKRGVRRATGRGGETRAVKKPCGRLNKKDPNKKAPRKCSVKETLINNEEEEGMLLVSPESLRQEVLSVLGQVAENLQEQETLDEQEGQRKCPPGCSTWEQFLRSVNALKAAEDGKLYQQRKEQ
jgi:hypothetical protein